MILKKLKRYQLLGLLRHLLKLSLGEYGRQRTSRKFHDLVLDLRFQNSRVLETRMFLALISRRKVSKMTLSTIWRGWDKSPSLSIIFGLSSKTQWLSGLYYADFISFYSPTQLCGGGTTKSNSNEWPISVPLSLSYNSAIWFKFTSATVSLPNIEMTIFTLLLSISVILPV